VLYYLSRAKSRLKWKKSQIINFQNKKIRQIIKNAYYNVPFYNRLFKSRRIFPDDIKTVDDLNKIPIVRKADLRKNPKRDLISTNSKIDQLKKLTSGGSTGEPFSIYINSKEDAWRKAIYLRANIICGQKPRDVWACVIDSQYSNNISNIQEFLGFFHRRIIPITLNKNDRFKEVSRINPDILDGFPNALCLIAKQQEKKEKKIKPKIIFGSGELITKNSIKILEKSFEASYFDQYGCTEIDRSAWQCQERKGYHMDVDSVITQFVDTNREEVSANEKGEIVYTSLFNHAFPIIRYNIEDVGVPIQDECKCGIKLPMMKVIEGRSNDFLIFPDNQIYTPIRFIELLGAFKLENEIEQYQIIQEKKDLIHIILKKTEKKVDEKEIKNLLQKNLKKITNSISKQKNDIDFKIAFKDKLSKTPRGKLKVVTSNL
jgi:phenylacetate-CoA ligase